jgi:heme exporter protein B
MNLTHDCLRGTTRVQENDKKISPSLLLSAWTIFKKDLRIELRTREILTTAGFFAALVAILAAVAFYSGVIAEIEVDGRMIGWCGPPLPPKALARIAVQIAPGAIWLPTAFASVLALGRTWQREREESALTGLLVSPVPRASIFLGKALGVLVFVFAVECIVVPIVSLMFHVELPKVIGSLVVVLLLGTVGVAATGTLFGAMTVRTRARDLVLASVLFPLLSPSLLSSVAATHQILQLADNPDIATAGAQLAEVSDYLLILGLFDGLAVLGGLGLFGALVDD